MHVRRCILCTAYTHEEAELGMYVSTRTQEHNACARDQGKEDYAGKVSFQKVILINFCDREGRQNQSLGCSVSFMLS